jgi:SAM-dependent methyltransferase
MKRQVRHAVDRIVLPYVEQLRNEIAGLRAARDPAQAEGIASEHRPPPGTTVSTQFHLMNHELRAIELERLGDRDIERALSVGANGSWYFEWFRHSVGDVVEHIGIEAYVPRPDDLPDYVTWIANTADRMVDVASESVDLVFAGQTSEHLWAHELTGFLCEAHRVLRSGGRLSLDSPNRRVTQHLDWSHGEHTIELDEQEMSSLLELAGFQVLEIAGIWRCVLDGTLLGLEDGLSDPATLVRRVATGRDRPQDCFVWWINAERRDRPIDVPELRSAVDQLFRRHWNTRVSRGFFADVGVDLLVPANANTTQIGRTLPFPLHGGTWNLRVSICDGTWDSVEAASILISAPGGHELHRLGLRNARREGETMVWTLDHPYLSFAVTIEVELSARADVVVQFPLQLSPGSN